MGAGGGDEAEGPSVEVLGSTCLDVESWSVDTRWSEEASCSSIMRGAAALVGLLMWPQGWRWRKKSGLRLTPVPAPSTCSHRVMLSREADRAFGLVYIRRLAVSALSANDQQACCQCWPRKSILSDQVSSMYAGFKHCWDRPADIGLAHHACTVATTGPLCSIYRLPHVLSICRHASMHDGLQEYYRTWQSTCQNSTGSLESHLWLSELGGRQTECHTC